MDLTDDARMGFGKWKGERLIDIPDSYWEWYKKQPGIKFSHPGLWKWLTKNENDSDTSNTDELFKQS